MQSLANKSYTKKLIFWRKIEWFFWQKLPPPPNRQKPPYFKKSVSFDWVLQDFAISKNSHFLNFE